MAGVRWTWAVASLLATAPSDAPRPVLVLPIACVVGRDCIVQKLPDLDAGPGRADYRCGLLTTDGHDGVDLRPLDAAVVARGVPILAAAAGTVARVRDGEPDMSVVERGGTDGRDAGNGIVIDHGGGWETQYSHARRGSIRVRPGQAVRAGEPIALVGLSGATEYPHLHFSVRRAGETIDPFTGRPIAAGCRVAGASAPLWSAAAGAALRYTPTALVAAGFGSGPPPGAPASRANMALATGPTLPLVLWGEVAGARAGDAQAFAIDGPDGQPVFRREAPVSRDSLIWFAFAGKRPPGGAWPSGVYRGRYTLSRAGVALADARVEVRLP